MTRFTLTFTSTEHPGPAAPVIIRLNSSKRTSMRSSLRFAQLPAVLALVAFTAFSQQLPQGVRKVTSVEGITEYALPNGLHVLLFPDDSKPKVTVNMTYLVGSRHEGYGETGMAHLLEHMLFKETKTGRDVKKELSDHGADFNGSTSYDRTNYYETVSATDENLQLGAGPRSRAHDRHEDGKGAARHRDDGGPQRVRDGREQPRPHPRTARARSRLYLPRLRPQHDRQPLRYRARADGPAGGVLSEVLPAR